MTSLSAYTLFESLLFFQSLAALDSKPVNFSSISDSLKANRFVRENPAFNVERLSPKALEELYLALLKEEIETQDARKARLNENAHDGEANPKKRKISASPPRTLEDASTHAKIMPDLVAHLYARYRDRAIKEIREDERQYEAVRRDLQNDGQPAAHIPSASPKPHVRALPANPYGASSNFPGMAPGGTPGNNPLTGSRPTSEKDTKAPIVSDNLHTGPRTAHHVPVGTTLPSTHSMEGRHTQSTPRQGKSDPNVQPSSGQRPLEPRLVDSGVPGSPAFSHFVHTDPQHMHAGRNQQPPEKQGSPFPHSRTPSQQGFSNGRPSPLGLPQQLGPDYQTNSSLRDQTPNPPYSQHRPPSVKPNQNGQATFSPIMSNGPSLSPVVLPPPPSYGNTNSPANGRHPSPTQHQSSSPQTSHHPLPGPPYSQQPWSAHNSPQIPYAHISPYAIPPHIPGRILPPPNVPPPTQDVNRPFQTPYQQPQQLPGNVPPQNYVQRPGSGSVQTPGGAFRPVDGRISNQFSTPVSTPQTTRKFTKSLRLDTSASTLTPWKMSVGGPPTSPKSPSRPGPDNVSPISDTEPSPIGGPWQVKTGELKVAQGTTKKASANTKKSDGFSSDLKVPAASTRSSRRNRAGSTASSNVAPSSARSRSQSIVSHLDEKSDAGSVKNRKIKREQPSTPAGIPADSDMELRTAGRRRRGTVGDEGAATRTSSKRKRGDAFDMDESSPRPPPGGLSVHINLNQVVTTKNFPRTAQTILQDIATHKHASLFAKPLTERDAPGYKDLIYRPQDLKSIKSAISHGSRAVAVATEANNTPAATDNGAASPGPFGTPILATSSGSGTGTGTPKNAPIILPKTTELIPPRAIVNSSQLEKELIRMFANAVMFNPTPERERMFGPMPGKGCGYIGGITGMSGSGTSGAGAGGDEEEQLKQLFLERGIIDDTRAMAEDVEKAVSSWRAAERAADDR